MKAFKDKKFVLVLSLFVVGLLYYSLFVYTWPAHDVVSLSVKSTEDLEISGGLGRVALDIILTKLKEEPVYNAQIVVEQVGESVVLAAKSAEELTSNLKLNYNIGADTIHVINLSNKKLMWLALAVYMCLSAGLILLVKDNKHFICMYIGCVCLSILVFFTGYILSHAKMDNQFIHKVTKYILTDKGSLRVYATYTDKPLDDILDSNANGCIDVVEWQDIRKDTDGDGLPDYFELCLCGLNPLFVNTNNDSLGDRDGDVDGDGLTNYQEYEYEYNPIMADTDYDGISDFDELTYGTDPLKWDTDVDGMSDGFEIEHGYDPLIKEKGVTVTKTLEAAGKELKNDLKVSTTITTDGFNAEGFELLEYESYLLNDRVPGYVCSAVKLYNDERVGFGVRDYDVVEGDRDDYGVDHFVVQDIADIKIESISFELNNSWFMDDNFDPCIYCYNQDTQYLEELNTVVSGNKVNAYLSSVQFEKLPICIVLNRAEVSKWMQETALNSSAFDETQNYTEEGDLDTLSDYVKTWIILGKLRTGTGLRLFEDVDFNALNWYINADVDGDEINNGDEICLRQHDNDYYIYVYSDPFKSDTNGDGIKDESNKDNLDDYSSSAVGRLSIACVPTKVVIEEGTSDKHFQAGNAFLTFDPYKDCIIDCKSEVSGYLPLVLMMSSYDFSVYYFPIGDILPYKAKKGVEFSIGYHTDEGASKDMDESWGAGLNTMEMQEYLDELAITGKNLKLNRLRENLKSGIQFNYEFMNVNNDQNYYNEAVRIDLIITEKQLQELKDYLCEVEKFPNLKYNNMQFALGAWNLLNRRHEAYKINYYYRAMGLSNVLCSLFMDKGSNKWYIGRAYNKDTALLISMNYNMYWSIEDTRLDAKDEYWNN